MHNIDGKLVLYWCDKGWDTMTKGMFDGSARKRILYTPSPFARNNLLFLQETGETESVRPHTSRRENLASFLFFTVLAGSGKVRFRNAEYEISKGDSVFIDCMEPYSHTCKEWKIMWVHFNGTGMRGIYDKFWQRTECPVFHTDSDAITETLKMISAEASVDDPVRDIRVNTQLAILIEEIMKKSLRPLSERRNKGLIEEIRIFLDANYTEKVTLDDLEKKFSLNRYSIVKEFKRSYGTTIIAYIQTKRISKAKELLRFSDMSIEAVGTAVGIGEPYYFSRIFHQLEGMSPREYRKTWK